MQNVHTTLKFALLAAALALLAAPGVQAAGKKVRDACAGDYDAYCSQYAPDSTPAKRCFESNRKLLSRGCIRALVDAGQVPAKYLKK